MTNQQWGAPTPPRAAWPPPRPPMPPHRQSFWQRTRTVWIVLGVFLGMMMALWVLISLIVIAAAQR